MPTVDVEKAFHYSKLPLQLLLSSHSRWFVLLQEVVKYDLSLMKKIIKNKTKTLQLHGEESSSRNMTIIYTLQGNKSDQERSSAILSHLTSS